MLLRNTLASFSARYHAVLRFSLEKKRSLPIVRLACSDMIMTTAISCFGSIVFDKAWGRTRWALVSTSVVFFFGLLLRMASNAARASRSSTRHLKC